MKSKIQDSSVLKNRVSALPKIQNWSWWKYLCIYALLGAIAIIMLFPLLWLISTALKSPNEDIFKFPPQLLPSQPTLQNFVEVWQTNPFGQYLFNSTLIAVLTVPKWLITLIGLKISVSWILFAMWVNTSR